jgi:nitrous oxidase accessory protein
MKVVFAIISMLFGLSVSATVIFVGEKEHLKSIKDALSVAGNGDTIIIRKGIYRVANNVITKSVAIIGEGMPVLDGQGTYEIFTISGKKIRIAGIHFANSGYSSMNDLAAITIVDASQIIIENCRFTNTYFGVHVANSTDFFIINNTFKGHTKSEQTTGNGIHLWKCSNAIIKNNRASGHRDGIYFEFVSKSHIIDNVSEGNIRYGLHFMFSNDDVYSGNVFRHNGAGVAVMFSRNVDMHKNTFANNWGPSSYGILLKEITDSKITRNTFQENTVGIYMEGANRIEVSFNLFKGNGWASRVQASCNANKFHHNNFISNTFDIGTNGSLVLNEFSGNFWDKYEGYDLNKDGVGDVSYRPVSMYSMLIEQNPTSLLLLRSFIISLLDKLEKAIPSLIPEDLTDDKPLMRRLVYDKN